MISRRYASKPREVTCLRIYDAATIESLALVSIDCLVFFFIFLHVFFFQAEDGIRYLVRSRGLGDVYKRQVQRNPWGFIVTGHDLVHAGERPAGFERREPAPLELSLIHI